MFNASLAPIASSAGSRLILGSSEHTEDRGSFETLTFGGVLDLWRTSEVFGDFFSEQLAAAPYRAFFWEMPPLTSARLELPFECVILDAVALTRMPTDRQAFAAPLARHTGPDGIACFRNLSGDARLVVPAALPPESDYPHLATFARRAPLALRHALWQNVGREIAGVLGDLPVWISTSGLGVAWLHVRLDTRPKYYQHRPYVPAPLSEA